MRRPDLIRTGAGMRGVGAETHVHTGGKVMQGIRRWIVPALLVGGLALSACSKAQEAAPGEPPAKVDQVVVAGSNSSAEAKATWLL